VLGSWHGLVEGGGVDPRQNASACGFTLRRRDLIAVVGGAVALWPVIGVAQPAKVPTIGVLVVQSPGSEQLLPQLKQTLHELGYVEGQTIRFVYRSDQRQFRHLPELAAELVQLKVDLIVTWFTPAATAAKNATREIPIVMALAGNPVETGLVESLARPGGNVTGISSVAAELNGKIVELIRELLPSARRVAALANAPDPFSKPFLEKIRLAGEATGLTIDAILVHGAGELEATFASMEKERPDAVIVQASLGLKRPTELALQHRIPAVSNFREVVEEGGLMAYAAVEADVYRRAAVFVDKILRGAKPAFTGRAADQI
jgi:ABC-type uncharacterized transport system substrate-binding protein